MSGEHNFIARWSRLKRSAALSKEPQAEAKVEDRLTTGEGAEPASRLPDKVQDEPVETEPPFDPASLPPIESIVAGTDIRAFLQKGVPKALTKAALRRAWTADPAIRDFMEVAENQWDFTDPTAIPGFGPLMTLSRLPRKYAGGLNDYRGFPLHVSRGIGMERGLAPQVRFFCPPEICVLEVTY